MSDEQAMEIIENLSEELGEKELKIMALEKSLEEQTKNLKQMIELSDIQQYKLDFLAEFGIPLFKPYWIIEHCPLSFGASPELMIKVIFHYFKGKIMTYDEIYTEIYCFHNNKASTRTPDAYVEWLMELGDEIISVSGMGADHVFDNLNRYYVCDRLIVD
tara:strand:+ start:226 stop:705 length:480 start_codon:yes stop_codon:yes gene_type:complete